MPPVVGGVALLLAFGRRGAGRRTAVRPHGLVDPVHHVGAVILAETFVAMPFLVITVEGALRAADTRFEEAAATLGRLADDRAAAGHAADGRARRSSRARCSRWARALGEFGATITFAGNFPGRTQTMPLAVYLALERDPRAAIALALVLLVVSLVVLALLRDRWLPGIAR